ncbi:zf-HC2 domain-containing protein, partial [candidate division KSB1 bacterium]|nr:zf-HC2 domain-containing protein [candidate division KSB1 bacterium]
MMMTQEFLCIEPEVGKDFRFRYPELLTPEEQRQFEHHLSICDACQEYWSIWREMALSQRLPALLQQARAELVQKQYQAALEIFTDAAKIDPQLLERADGLAFFTHPAWISLTAAHSPTQDLLPSLARAYDPAREALT